jgi:integrase
VTRTVTDAKIETPSSRLKLKARGLPYWRPIDAGGLHLGYRKGENGGGRWVGRKYVGKRAGRAPYDTATLPGCADDTAPADGVRVLDYGQAIEAVRAWAAPKPVSAAGPLTVKQAVDDYVAWLKAHRKSGKDAEQRLTRHLLPKLGDKEVAALTTRDVQAVQNAMVRHDPDDPEVERRSKDSANRVMNSFRAALNRAFEDPANGIPSSAAWDRVKSFKGVDKAREVYLEPAQVKRLLQATEGTALGRLIIATLLTGARPPHELARPQVRDFDQRQRTLRISDGKTGGRVVTLSPQAANYFAGLAKGKADDDLLLAKENGGPWRKSDHSRPMREAVKRAKLPAATTLYSLRHTHISDAIISGMPLTLLAENCGTSIGMIEKNYAKAIAATRQQVIAQHGYKIGTKLLS